MPRSKMCYGHADRNYKICKGRTDADTRVLGIDIDFFCSICNCSPSEALVNGNYFKKNAIPCPEGVMHLINM